MMACSGIQVCYKLLCYLYHFDDAFVEGAGAKADEIQGNKPVATGSDSLFEFNA